jgi:hypothetical protein
MPDPTVISGQSRLLTSTPRRSWPANRLGESLARHRGQYCYVAALLPGRSGPTPILRLHYQGSADHWAIAIYKDSTGQYTEAEPPGSFGPATGTPEQGIDDTLILYADTTTETETPSPTVTTQPPA